MVSKMNSTCNAAISSTYIGKIISRCVFWFLREEPHDRPQCLTRGYTSANYQRLQTFSVYNLFFLVAYQTLYYSYWSSYKDA